MADSFDATADVMMQDARTLHQAGAYRNACYLAGYVVECTMKVLLKLVGPARRVHDLESLHEDVDALLAAGNAMVARYGDPSAMAPTMLSQVKAKKWDANKGRYRYYCHWDPEHRYDGTQWQSRTTSEAYLGEADKCHDTIAQMVLDGVL